MTHNEHHQPPRTNQSDTVWDRCLTGAAVVAPLGAYKGGQYGFRTGAIGAIGTGGLTAPFTIAGATIIGTAVGGIGGAVAGCAGNVMLQDYLDDIPIAPHATPQPLAPIIPERGR